MANTHPACKDCRYDCFANNGGKCTVLTATRNGCSMYKHAAQALEEKEAIHNYFQSGRRNDIQEELRSIRRRYAR